MQHALSPLPTIPENAPFTPRQRAWLNGFFAGLVSTGRAASGGEAPLVSADLGDGSTTASVAAPTQPSWKDVVDDDVNQYAWHRSELPLEERMQLADGQPMDLRLMAAMAQLDCGQCGYLCRTYAKAIETGEESDLKKCAPGGKSTSRMLVQLQRELAPVATASAQSENSDISRQATSLHKRSEGNGSATASGPEAAVGALAPQLAYSRQNPFPAPAIRVEKLTGEGSAKDTRLVSLSLSGSGLQYKVGDALGVFPKNAKEQVEALIRLFGHDGGEPVRTPDGVSTTLRGALTEHCDIKSASDDFLELLWGKASDKEEKRDLKRCLDDEEVTGLVSEPRLIDIVARFRDIRLTVEEIIKSLDSLKPRLYSIASSPVVNPNQVDLVVGVVQYVLAGEQRRGVASTFLANRMIGHEPVPVFVQPCQHFGLPDDPQTPVIMVGPGTGVAPFRAFLHERRALQAAGKNWLFFGDQHAATDFLLKEEFEDMLKDGLLSRLSTAFSRDQQERHYVQHRMLEQSTELWRWLQEGAHFYVCGDAARMAGDVDRALHAIAERSGNLSPEAAAEYIRNLKKSNRYQRDVY